MVKEALRLPVRPRYLVRQKLCRIRLRCLLQRRRLSSPPTSDHLAALAAASSSSSSASARPRSRGGSGPSSLSGSKGDLHREESERDSLLAQNFLENSQDIDVASFLFMSPANTFTLARAVR